MEIERTLADDPAVMRDAEIPRLRAEMERKIMDVRTEARGWAEIAVRTAGKVDAASEIVNLIYRDLRKVKEVQDQHTKTLDQHTKTLDQHTKILDQHGQLLDQHGKLLEQHTVMLNRQDEKLDLHTEMLEKILAKMS